MVKKKSTKTKKKSSVTKKPLSTEFNWQFLTLIIGSIALILTILALFLLLVSFQSYDNSFNDFIKNDGELYLFVIEDNSCVNCQVNRFISQFETTYKTPLNVIRFNLDDNISVNIIEQFNFKTSPIYIFNSKIRELDFFNNIEGSLEEIQINDQTFFLIDERSVPNLILISEIEHINTSITLGSSDAPVTIALFSDFSCPFCSLAHGNVDRVNQIRNISNPEFIAPLPAILSEFVSQGKVRFIFYNALSPTSHPNAIFAHTAAFCAFEQDLWIEYKTLIVERENQWQRTIDPRIIFFSFADELNLDSDAFRLCYDSERYNQQVEMERELAQQIGLRSIPTFYINKHVIIGAEDFRIIQVIIDNILQNY